MRVFIPYKDFIESIKTLHSEELKLNLSSLERIISVITIKESRQFLYCGVIAYATHPEVLLWEKHLSAAKLFYNLTISFLNMERKPYQLHPFSVFPDFGEGYYKKQRAALSQIRPEFYTFGKD